MSREDETNGLNMGSTSSDFELFVNSSGTKGLFYDKFHSRIYDNSSVIWTVTADSNMKNYSSSDSEIRPGSYGKLEFYITPKKDINLDFSFEFLAYNAEFTSGTETVSAMNQLNQSVIPAKFLNGHILLFGSRTGTAPDYVYSDPILSGADMKKTVKNKQYLLNDGAKQPVTIYWVWPNTLSTLITVNDSTVITDKTNFCYSDVVSNICQYPDYYMKGVDRPAAGSPLDPADIVTNYEQYGDYYDQADNDIGMGIGYVLLKLTVSESLSGGG